ncbi:MAG: dienelactone hydrolase family protein [Bryobacteraceae bacterium]|nr:dienelactone hydrolase family protein [Bryobacteraceae bacterium]
MTRLHICVLLASLPLAAETPFDYDRSRPLDVQEVRRETREGVQIRDITFSNLTGGRTEAYLITPPDGPVRAGILYIHWYEPPNPTSNRTQHIGEATRMAKLGVVSLLPATMWSDFEWFRKRKREDDLANSLTQLKELRRALDLLLAQPGVNPKRVAFVGHDFGAMFGAVLAGVDRRPVAYALQAGTTSFTNWYLFGPPMREPARAQFIRDLSILAPVRHIANAAPAPVLLQFATRDIFVSQDVASDFFEAAKPPREIVFYDAEHGMNAQSVEDRIAWLTRVLSLR